MAASMRYVPPPNAPPDGRGTPPAPIPAAVLGHTGQQRPQRPPFPITSAPPRRPPASPVLGLAGRTPLDIEQQMRAFMVERRGQQGNGPGSGSGPAPQLMSASRAQRNVGRGKPRIIPGGRGPAAITTSQTYYKGDRVFTRTELIPLYRHQYPPGASPSPPTSISPDSPQNRAGPQRLGGISRSQSYPWNAEAAQVGRRPSGPPQAQTQTTAPGQAQFNKNDGPPRADSSSQRRYSLQPGQRVPPARIRAGMLERTASTSAYDPRLQRNLNTLHTPSISPPPTPPEKDEYWKDLQAGSPPVAQNTRPNASHVDSVLLPPPPSSMMPRRSNSLNRQNNPNLRIEVPSQSPTEAQSSGDREKEKEKEKNSKSSGKRKKKEVKVEEKEKDKGKNKEGVLENVLGIYPANKLPPGRSAADIFASKATNFFRKTPAPLTTKSTPTPKPTSPDNADSRGNTPDKTPPPQPWSADMASKYPVNSPDGSHMAELPGSTPPLAEDTPASTEPRESPSKKQSTHGKSRPTKKKSSKYEHMPLPAVPPEGSAPTSSDAIKNQLSLTIPSSFSEDTELLRPTEDDQSLCKDLEDWFDTLYVDPQADNPSKSPSSPQIVVEPARIDEASRASVINPNGAVMNMYSMPRPRSTLRVRSTDPPRTLSAASIWGARTSYASSMGDAFQYDPESSMPLTGPSLSGPWDPGLATIGEMYDVEEEEDSANTSSSEKHGDPPSPKTRTTYVPFMDTFKSGAFSPDIFNPDGYNSDLLSPSVDAADYSLDPEFAVHTDHETGDEHAEAGEENSVLGESERDDAEKDGTELSLFDYDDLFDDDRSSTDASAAALEADIEAILAKRRTTLKARREGGMGAYELPRNSVYLPSEYGDDEVDDVDLDGDDQLEDEDDADVDTNRFDEEIDAVLAATEKAQEEVDAQLRPGKRNSEPSKSEKTKMGETDIASPLPAVAFSGIPRRDSDFASVRSSELTDMRFNRPRSAESFTLASPVAPLPAVAFRPSNFAQPRSFRDSDDYGSVRDSEIDGMRFGDSVSLSSRRVSEASVQPLPSMAMQQFSLQRNDSVRSTASSFVEPLPAMAMLRRRSSAPEIEPEHLPGDSLVNASYSHNYGYGYGAGEKRRKQSLTSNRPLTMISLDDRASVAESMTESTESGMTEEEWWRLGGGAERRREFERRTRYIAGRNSELDADVIFCLKSTEMKSPGLPPPRRRAGTKTRR